MKQNRIIMELTIFQRLTAGYLAIMLMVLSFGGYVAFQLNRLTRITHLAAGPHSDTIQIAESLSARLPTLIALEKKYWISRDNDFLILYFKRQYEFIKDLNTLIPLVSEDEAKIMVQEAVKLSQSYLKRVETLADRGNDLMPSQTYESERDDLIRVLSKSLKQIVLAGERARDEKIRKSELISARVLKMTIGFAVACILVGLAVSFLTTRRIVHPLVVLQQKTREIAAGRFVTIKDLRAPMEIRKLSEDFNTMSERLSELDSMKEDFISHMSHALRTPLTAIWEASEMLINGTFEKDPESRRQLLTIIRDECKSLIVSVNRILDLSRMEAGMMDYQFTKVNLNDLIQSTIVKLSPIAQANKIRMEFEPPTNLPPVLADNDQLKQLLENLIGNALKFTDSQGRITLKILPPQAGDDKIQVSITDTGCGIEPEHLESIFVKFRRIEKGKNTTRGTGLGLAIAKHIVTAHGGNIWVESKKDKGSTFYFSLPHA